jgi:hypothetical protein
VLLRLRPFFIVTAIALLFFGDLVLHPSQVLYSNHSDLLAMHLPLKRFLVRSWHETGVLPLWCPFSFGGMPLIHDVQVAAFYPLHGLLYLVPEERIGTALSWLVVLHVMIAGWCMTAYARSQGLGQTAALVAAIGYMFAGKWMLHVLAAGHYIMIPLAWLPLVLLWFEQAIERRSLLCATWAGAAFALIILGTHPQLTLYAGLFCAVWTFGCWWNRGTGAGISPVSPDATNGSFSRFFMSWLKQGTWCALMAALLSAVQLLPSLEAAPESSRALGVPAGDIIAAAAPTFMNLIGPGWTEGWEDRAGLGVLWIAAAAMAAFLCRGRARYQAAVCVFLLLFALGGAAAIQWLPGFRLFQLPGRMLMLLSFPVALLAARATQVLVEDRQPASPVRNYCRRVLLRVLAISVFFAGCSGVVAYVTWCRESAGGPAAEVRRSLSEWLRQLPVAVSAYWLVVLLTAPFALWLLSDRLQLGRRAWRYAWVCVLILDAAGLALPHVAVRCESDLYRPSQCVEYLVDRKKEEANHHWRVLDRALPGQPANSPLGAALPLLGSVELEPVLGYNSFDLRRTKEYLQLIVDEDQPLRPREGIFGYPLIGSFPIRNKGLLDLLGARFLLQPKDGSLALDGAGEPTINHRWQPGPEDPNPTAYSFLTGDVQKLPPYRIFENLDAFPRAFVVARASALRPRPQVLEQMKTTDFRHQVLLEGMLPPDGVQSVPSGAIQGEATIRQYTPNRVVVEVRTATAGYLVLTDNWFPGWTCMVDGIPAELHRANFLFRGVAVPAGIHEVVFSFTPSSYWWGKRISAGALVGLLVCLLLPWVRKKTASNPQRMLVQSRSLSSADNGMPRRPASFQRWLTHVAPQHED